jgi:hypothetical protein
VALLTDRLVISCERLSQKVLLQVPGVTGVPYRLWKPQLTTLLLLLLLLTTASSTSASAVVRASD